MKIPAIAFVLLTIASPQFGPAPQNSSAALETAATQAEGEGRLAEAFALYVRAVQALPERGPVEAETRLREKTIRLAAQLRPKPAVPEDADRFTVRGQVLFKDAQDEAGFVRAEGELRKAVRVAPWLPEAAYNLALVEEKLQYYRSAAANLKLYLLSNPQEAPALRAKMYEFELRGEENKEAASKEACAFGDVGACSTVATLNAPRFLVRHLSGVFLYNWIGFGYLTIANGVQYVEDDSDKSSHSFAARCDDINKVEKNTKLGAVWTLKWSFKGRSDYEFIPFEKRGMTTIDEMNAHKDEILDRANEILSAIRRACPQLKQ